MESLERSRAVIDLGKQLIAQLKLGDDEATQWMAHALAERINEAENAPPERRVAAQDSCADLIFQLWEQRYSLPNQLRPLRSLEPLLRTLNSLDVNNGPRFRFIQKHPAEVNADEDIEKNLNFAMKLDEAARVLVHHFLAIASEQATEESRGWIKSAAEAGADVTLEIRLVRFVNDVLGNSADAAQTFQKNLADKIEKLEKFAYLATSVATELRELQRDVDPTNST